MTEDRDDSLVVQLIERMILAARYRALCERYPANRSGFLKMARRHESVGAALMVKVVSRDVAAPRLCPWCDRS